MLSLRIKWPETDFVAEVEAVLLFILVVEAGGVAVEEDDLRLKIEGIRGISGIGAGDWKGGGLGDL